jgi:hypothetical protein
MWQPPASLYSGDAAAQPDPRCVGRRHWQPDSISISEGHGYGMLILALMAGYDPHAQTYFDGMFRMFTDHQAAVHAFPDGLESGPWL